MKKRIVLALAGFMCAAPVAVAETADPVAAFGAQSCVKVLEDKVEGIDGAPYRAAIAAIGWDQAQFCGCVGTVFSNNRAEQSAEVDAAGDDAEAIAAAFNRILVRNLDTCVPGDGEADDEVTDGDLQGTDETFQIDPEDTRMCHIALAGDLPIAGVDADAVKAGIKADGRSDDDFCGCVATWIAAEGEQGRKAVEDAANPMQAYQGQLGAAIEGCR